MVEYAVLLVFLLVIIGIVFHDRRKLTKLAPYLRPWGEGKDLSALMAPLPIEELENWWNITQSDKARIRQLEGQLATANLQFERMRNVFIAEAKKRRELEAVPQMALGPIPNPKYFDQDLAEFRNHYMSHRERYLMEIPQEREEPPWY